MKRIFLSLLLAFGAIGHAADEPKPETIKHRITGLFEPERAEHLRALFKGHPKVKLLSIDFARAEGTFSYDPKTYSNADFGQWMHDRTFQIKPASATPADKLPTIEIAVLALDCKGAALPCTTPSSMSPASNKPLPHEGRHHRGIDRSDEDEPSRAQEKGRATEGSAQAFRIEMIVCTTHL